MARYLPLESKRKRKQEHGMKKIKLKHIVYAVFILLFIVLIVFIILFQRNIRTAASVKKLEDGLYSMEYKGDYNLDDFLEQGVPWSASHKFEGWLLWMQYHLCQDIGRRCGVWQKF